MHTTGFPITQFRIQGCPRTDRNLNVLLIRILRWLLRHDKSWQMTYSYNVHIYEIKKQHKSITVSDSTPGGQKMFLLIGENA